MSLNDIDLIWNGDWVITPSGGINTISGADKVLQRVIRRFLSNAQVLDGFGRCVTLPDCLWHNSYGGNAGQVVNDIFGKVSTQKTEGLRQKFIQQAAQETGVANSPAPIVVFHLDPSNGSLTMDCTIALANGTVATANGVIINP